MDGGILIVGTHRSGTTNLLNSLAQIFDTSKIEEPWNYYLFSHHECKYPQILQQYGIVKSLVEQVPYYWKKEYTVDFYLDLIDHYSKVVLLGRKNRIAIAESYARQMQFGDHDWHKEYSIEDTSILKLDMEFINETCDTLIEISEKSGIPITWYEDLYSGEVNKLKKVVNNWNFNVDIPILLEYTNPHNRYRKFKTKI